jgi:SNF2 family DNA or RNA helicase
MNKAINVDYSDKTGRFIIHSPFWALELMRSIPNRKFEKKLDNAWTAPALRANVQYLFDKMPSGTSFTDAARVKMHDVLNPGKPPEEPFPARYKFKREPRGHQMEALHWVYSKRAFALFMDMRTGKTKVVIDLSMAMWNDAKLERLVVIPLLTLRRNWFNAFNIDADMSKVDVHFLNSDKPKEFDKWNSTNDGRLKVLLSGVESMSAGRAHGMVLEFCAGPKTMVIVDESDTIKNHKAIRTERMFQIRDKCEYRGILTGTPISKGPMDFFAQFEFIDPNIFGIGDYYSFRNRYALMGGYDNKEIVGYQNMAEFIEISKPYVYQVRYQDVFDSPPAEYEVRTVQMTDEQKIIYKRIRKDNTIRDSRDPKIIKLVVQNVLEKTLRLHEVCGGYWAEKVDTGKFKTVDVLDSEGKAIDQIRRPIFKYLHHPVPGRNPKLDECVRLLTEEFSDDQGIVWAVHLEELFAIAAALGKHGPVALFHGGVSEDERAQIDSDFRAGKIKWLVANPTTGGRGYTFDVAMVMVNFTSSQNLIHRLQSLERATAAHKTVPVAVIDIVVENSVDELYLEALTNKQNVADFVRDAIEKRGSSVDSLPF